jgi:hypothetical protein
VVKSDSILKVEMAEIRKTISQRSGHKINHEEWKPSIADLSSALEILENYFGKLWFQKQMEDCSYKPKELHKFIHQLKPMAHPIMPIYLVGVDNLTRLKEKRTDAFDVDTLKLISFSDVLREVEKNRLEMTLRTSIGIDLLDASEITDYLFKDCVPKKEKAHLHIPNRFWLKSTEQSLLAVYTEESICPLNIFTMYKCSKMEAKMLSVYFNSIFYLIQALMFAKQSTRGYLGLKILDFSNILVPNCAKLTKEGIAKLEQFFENNKCKKIESLPAQLQLSAEFRLILDKVVAESMGIKISEQELTNLYKLVWNHIHNLP